MLNNSFSFFRHALDSLEEFKIFFTLVGEKRWRWREIQLHEFGCKSWKDCHLYMDFYINDYADGSPRSCRSELSQAKSKFSVLRLQTWRKEPNSAWLYRSRGQACKGREGGLQDAVWLSQAMAMLPQQLSPLCGPVVGGATALLHPSCLGGLCISGGAHPHSCHGWDRRRGSTNDSVLSFRPAPAYAIVPSLNNPRFYFNTSLFGTRPSTGEK